MLVVKSRSFGWIIGEIVDVIIRADPITNSDERQSARFTTLVVINDLSCPMSADYAIDRPNPSSTDGRMRPLERIIMDEA